MRIFKKGRSGESGPLLVSRIVVAIALTIVVTCMAIAALTINQSYREIRQAHLDRARDHAVTAFRAAVDAETYPTLPQLVEFGGHLVAISAVRGGAYFDSVGDFQAHFGVRPAMTWHTAKLQRLDRLFVNDGAEMEIFIDPSEIGIQHGVALRFGLGETWEAIDAEVARKITAILATSLASAAALTLLITAIVLVPLNRIRRAVANALDDPKSANANALNMRRRDEIGQLSRGIDELFYVMSNTFKEDLGNALAIQAHIQLPLVIYTGEGIVDDANPAALDFFGAATRENIAAIDRDAVRLNGEVKSVRALAEREAGCQYGEILCDETWIPCIIGSGTIRRKNGAVRRYFLIFADLSAARAQLHEALSERDATRAEVSRLRARSRELRQLLDACTAIIEGGRRVEPDGHRLTMPERIVNSWYRDALIHGQMTPRSLRHTVLPSIQVKAELAERLFASALSAVRSRSRSRTPNIAVSAPENHDGFPRFSISEVTDDHNAEARIDEAASESVSLLVAAFVNLLRAAGGQIVSLSGSSGENTLVFRLPAAEGQSRGGEVARSRSKAG